MRLALGARPPSAVVRGVCWMLFGGVAYIFAAVCSRLLAPDYSVFEVVFIRCVVGLMFIAPGLIRLPRAELRTTQLPLHGFRTILTYSGTLCWFWGVTLVPIADYYALQFMTPILTIAGAVLVLGERAGLRTWIAVAVAFGGALIILRPGFMEVSFGLLIALGAALCYAGVNVCVKVLSRRDRAVVIVMYVNLLLVPVAGLFAIFNWRTPEWTDLPLFIGVGVFATMGQLGQTWGIAAADARIIQTFDFLRLPLAALIGWIVFRELSDAWVWVGAFVIFSSAYSVLHRERRATA